MKLLTAFFRLIRWPNLVFILLTQFLFYYCIVQRIEIPPVASNFSFRLFWHLVMASVLIAAAGYIINDYFDLNIDLVNKPAKLVIDKIIKRRWAMVWHIALSLIGVALCFYIDLHSHTFWLGAANLVCVFLLFGYSVALKKKLLIGNILISVLTAWVIIVVYLCYQNSFYIPGIAGSQDPNIKIRFTRIAMLYAGFAFVISLIREVIKDIEDMEGDAKYGCKDVCCGVDHCFNRRILCCSILCTAVWLVVERCVLYFTDHHSPGMGII